MEHRSLLLNTFPIRTRVVFTAHIPNWTRYRGSHVLSEPVVLNTRAVGFYKVPLPILSEDVVPSQHKRCKTPRNSGPYCSKWTRCSQHTCCKPSQKWSAPSYTKWSRCSQHKWCMTTRYNSPSCSKWSRCSQHKRCRCSRKGTLPILSEPVDLNTSAVRLRGTTSLPVLSEAVALNTSGVGVHGRVPFLF